MPRIRIIYVTAQRAQSTKIRNFALSSKVADFGRSLHMFLNEYCSHLLAQFRLCVFDIRYFFSFCLYGSQIPFITVRITAYRHSSQGKYTIKNCQLLEISNDFC